MKKEIVLSSLWDSGVPPFIKDNAKDYKEYVDKLAVRINKFLQEGK